MIQIKPCIHYYSSCYNCEAAMSSSDILWHGRHILYKFKCPKCSSEIFEDLKVGHAVNHLYQVNLTRNQFWKKSIYTTGNSDAWLGKSLIHSLNNPLTQEIKISKTVLKNHKNVILLNCIDNYYGHCILKLLNAQRHLEKDFDKGLVVIVPKFLQWMVPEGVAEIWVVDLSLKNGEGYYPALNNFVQTECTRFDEIYLSEAYSHPSQFDITKFTQIPRHSFDEEKYKITFIWREDRVWADFLPFRIFRRFKLFLPLLWLQNLKVRSLFQQIRLQLPLAEFTVVGLGKNTRFPKWIEDLRVDSFDEKSERLICHIYSKSRLVIGIHGSNMLLPSGHAGMTLDLMPKDRWGNFAQDILYQEDDSRLAAFKYRFLPLRTQIKELARISLSMILGYLHFNRSMQTDKTL